jgi:hypothetical protein
MSYRRVAYRYAYKTRVTRLVKRYISAKTGSNKTREIFEEKAPTYKSKASDKEILWATAYDDKDHPNHQQAVADYEKWVENNSEEGFNKRLFTERSSIGGAIKKYASKIASKSWGALKAVAKQGKSEVAGMLLNTPKLLYKMTTGKYDFSDKETLKKDLKTIWGSAVYYGGITACVATAGAAAPLLTAQSTIVALGKSIASHAVIGAVNNNADFWGFLSFEAVETTAALANKGSEFSSLMGGFVSTDLFDGAVAGISTALKTIASEPSDDEHDKEMVKFLTKVNLAVGEFMEKVSDDEMKEIGDEI